MATDSIDRVRRPFLPQKARTHFQTCGKVADSEFSKALLTRSHMVALSSRGDASRSSSWPRAPLRPRTPALCREPSAPAADPRGKKLRGCVGAFPLMESDVFNWLIWAWHRAGAGAEPSQVNPPPPGSGPPAAG